MSPAETRTMTIILNLIHFVILLDVQSEHQIYFRYVQHQTNLANSSEVLHC